MAEASGRQSAAPADSQVATDRVTTLSTAPSSAAPKPLPHRNFVRKSMADPKQGVAGGVTSKGALIL